MKLTDIIEIRNIKKSYGDNIVLRDITVGLEKGKIYGLVGKNGVGKSTLLKILVGLLKSDSGSIYYKDKELKDDCAHLNDFGVLIEDATFYNGISTLEVLKIHCEYMGYYNLDEIEKTLHELGLSHHKNNKTKFLSKGEKQRLAIARALITKPKVLLLDEPTIGLDPSFINITRNMILKLNEDYGTTVIISSHILTELELFVDKVLFLKDGVIAENTSMKEIRDNCGEYLELRVDSPSKASVILERDLKIKNYRLLNEDIIRLYDTDVNCCDIVQFFSHKGIRVFQFSKKEASLHEYYLDIIEGGN